MYDISIFGCARLLEALLRIAVFADRPNAPHRSRQLIVPGRRAAARADRARAREQAGVQLPFADKRARVQSPQNGWVTLVMIPISPPPSR